MTNRTSVCKYLAVHDDDSQARILHKHRDVLSPPAQFDALRPHEARHTVQMSSWGLFLAITPGGTLKPRARLFSFFFFSSRPLFKLQLLSCCLVDALALLDSRDFCCAVCDDKNRRCPLHPDRLFIMDLKDYIGRISRIIKQNKDKAKTQRTSTSWVVVVHG